MSAYQTDEEQVEAIKKWWTENGKSVVAGVVLGFAIVGGWQGWSQYEQTQGELASQQYDQMMQFALVGEDDKASELAKQLASESPGNVYASFAAFEMAKIAYSKGEKAVAKQQLESVIANAKDESMVLLARMRLANLALDIKDYATASSVLNDVNDPAFAGEVEALKGDIALAQGDKAAAIVAYKAALAAGVKNNRLLRMKLIDAGGEA